MLGALGGTLVGARILATAHTRAPRAVFTTVVVVLAVEMLHIGLLLVGLLTRA